MMKAMYPSPAGATESALSLESWEEILSQNFLLQTMEPNVEAFLVNRVGPSPEYFLVPIDECFRLVGLIRMHWKGLSGARKCGNRSSAFLLDCVRVPERQRISARVCVPDLQFQIEGAESVPHSAAPLLALKLRITNAPAEEEIQTLSLRCQVQIEPTRRRYSE